MENVGIGERMDVEHTEARKLAGVQEILALKQ